MVVFWGAEFPQTFFQAQMETNSVYESFEYKDLTVDYVKDI